MQTKTDVNATGLEDSTAPVHSLFRQPLFIFLSLSTILHSSKSCKEARAKKKLYLTLLRESVTIVKDSSEIPFTHTHTLKEEKQIGNEIIFLLGLLYRISRNE